MKKTLLIFLFAAVLLLGASALAEDGYTYAIEDGCATVTAYTGGDTVITVPEALGGCPVTAIGAKAFYRSSVTRVTLPQSVTFIGERAFAECTSLTAFAFPEVIEDMGGDVFNGCTSLETVTMPSTMYYIPDRTFFGCSALHSGSMWMPNGVLSIGEEAFLGCASMTAMHIRDCTSIVEDRAFADCDELFLVSVDTESLYFGADVFAASPKVRLICYRGSKVATYAETNGIDYVFITCSEHGESETVTVLPTETEDGVYITRCKDCYFEFSREPMPETDFLYSLKDGEATVTKYVGSDTEVTVPAAIHGYPVVSIGKEAFCGSKIAYLTVESGVRRIEAQAFAYCRSLCDIDLPETLLYIGDEAFAYSFTDTFCEIRLPSSVTEMGDSVFACCERLTSVDMPDSLTALGNSTFYACNNLRIVILPEGLAEIPTGTFYASRMGLEMLYIPKSVKRIGTNAFWQGDTLGVVLYTVCYGGSAEDFLKITFAEGNTNLINHDIVFGASAYSFDTRGGEPMEPYFATVPLSVLPTPVREGSAFVGWYATADLSGERLTAPLDPKSSVTLYAKWATTPAEKMDFSGDGVLSVSDALLALGGVLNGNASDDRDVSGDGQFTLIDILRILRNITE